MPKLHIYNFPYMDVLMPSSGRIGKIEHFAEISEIPSGGGSIAKIGVLKMHLIKNVRIITDLDSIYLVSFTHFVMSFDGIPKRIAKIIRSQEGGKPKTKYYVEIFISSV